MNRISAVSVISVFGALLFGGAGSPAAASTICSFSLDDLIAEDGSITVGDKLFDQFGYLSTGDMPDASGVNVVPTTDAGGNFGLRFQGGFLDLFDDNPRFLISDVHLAGNPAIIGPEGQESGLIGVQETFLPDDLTSLAIFDIEPGSTVQLVDWDFLTTPVKTLHVQKDIIAFADAAGSAATLSFVDQTFSQVAAVPEPSTISLLILGMAALWRLRRKSA
jgi:hypothetical protein